MINNSEDLNKYYNIVNQYVDEYIDKWKIKPTNLKNYLLGNKSRLVNFLEKKGLKDINRIDRIVSDVIDHRVELYNDGVITFESFKLLESEDFRVVDLKQCLYKGIEKCTIEHEKILADFFDLSLSQVDPISTEKHLFWVHDIDTPVVVYNSEEMSVIRENIIDYVYNQLTGKTVSLDVGREKFEVNLGTFISEQQFKEKFSESLDNTRVQEIISSLLYTKKLSDCSEYVICQMM